jgi:hypothetical protein
MLQYIRYAPTIGGDNYCFYCRVGMDLHRELPECIKIMLHPGLRGNVYYPPIWLPKLSLLVGIGPRITTHTSRCRGDAGLLTALKPSNIQRDVA